MRQYTIFFAFIILFTANLTLHAQTWRKFQSYCIKGDYSKANDLRAKSKAQDTLNPGWNYVLSEFYLLRDQPRYHIDSAFIFNQKALFSFNIIKKDNKALEKWKKAGIREYLLTEQNRKIQDLAFDSAQVINTILGYEHFMSLYTDTHLFAKARAARNELAFEQAKQRMDFTSFQDFLLKYPDAKQGAEARALYERLLFEKTTQSKTWQSFLEYLNTYPEGAYVDIARKEYLRRKLDDAYKGNTQTIYSYILEETSSPYLFEASDSIIKRNLVLGITEEWWKVIVQYPLIPKIKEVWLRFYLLETANDDSKSYSSFSTRFPQFPLKDVLKKDSLFSERDYVVYEEYGKYGFLFDSLRITEPIYDEALSFSGRLAAVSLSCTKNSCLYGYLNKSLQMQINPRFIEADDFMNGFAIVSDSSCINGACKYGVINEDGQYVILPEYESVSQSGHGFWIAEKSKKFQYLSHTGIDLMGKTFRKARKFYKGIAAVAQDSGWYFIDTTGRKIHDGYFTLVSDFVEGVAQASPQGNLWGYLLPNGSWLSEPVWLAATPFENGRARVSREEKVMKKGKEVYELKSYDLFTSGKLVPVD